MPPLFYVLQQHQLVLQSIDDKAGGSLDVQFGGNVAACHSEAAGNCFLLWILCNSRLKCKKAGKIIAAAGEELLQ